MALAAIRVGFAKLFITKVERAYRLRPKHMLVSSEDSVLLLKNRFLFGSGQ